MAKHDDGRCCNTCTRRYTIYREWDCMGTWTSENKCGVGHDLEETNGTDCDDYIEGI